MKPLLFTFAFFLSIIALAQNDKVVFIKEVPIKMPSTTSYNFYIGYEVSQDSDIAIDFSGGPSKFWAGKTTPVSKGKGLVPIDLPTKDNPPNGTGYKLVVSVRERNGGWQTTKFASIIDNIEIVKKATPILDDASFSPLTPTKFSDIGVYNFDIQYKASQQRNIVVAIYDQGKWVAASKAISVEKGSGTERIQIKTNPLPEGNKYRFILYYGSDEDFPNTYLVSKEMSGILISKPEKVITLSSLRKRSIRLSINKDSDILTIPGDLTYKFIKIIAMNGAIVKESQDSNSVQISDLPKGGYFAITNKDESYQFIKF